MPSGHPETAIVPYLRGELSGGERERVASHLEQCAQCRESAQSFESLLAELSSRIDEIPVPDWDVYRAELRRKLDARAEPRARWWRPGVAWASLAAAGLAVLTLWLAIGPRRPGVPPPIDQLAAEQDIVVANVGLLRNYDVLQRLDLLENYDVIEHLDQIGSGTHPTHDERS
jgi:anti-sigma factor RsiW